jgi:hypothetical protein
MVVLRLVGVFVLIALGACFLLFLITRNRRYLTFAWRVLQFAFMFLIAFMALYVLERVVLVL